jgi:hypothetical protein
MVAPFNSWRQKFRGSEFVEVTKHMDNRMASEYRSPLGLRPGFCLRGHHSLCQAGEIDMELSGVFKEEGKFT